MDLFSSPYYFSKAIGLNSIMEVSIMAKNSICHLEIMTKDTKKASDFYAALFGWEMNSYMGDEYVMFKPDAAPGGGISKSADFTPGSGIVFYVEVDDIDAYLKKVVELGGKEKIRKTQIPNIGWYGQFTDPDGNIIGLFSD